MHNLRFGFEVLKSKFDLGRRNTTKVSQKFVNFGESEVLKLPLFSFEIIFTYQKTPSRHSQINLRLKVDTEVSALRIFAEQIIDKVEIGHKL